VSKSPVKEIEDRPLQINENFAPVGSPQKFAMHKVESIPCTPEAKTNKYHRVNSPLKQEPVLISEQSCSFSPDSKFLMSNRTNGRASVRDQEIGEAEAELERIANEINLYRVERAKKLRQQIPTLDVTSPDSDKACEFKNRDRSRVLKSLMNMVLAEGDITPSPVKQLSEKLEKEDNNSSLRILSSDGEMPPLEN